jgi:predicted secreted protein
MDISLPMQAGRKWVFDRARVQLWSKELACHNLLLSQIATHMSIPIMHASIPNSYCSTLITRSPKTHWTIFMNQVILYPAAM